MQEHPVFVINFPYVINILNLSTLLLKMLSSSLFAAFFFLTFRSLNSVYQIWPSFSLWFLGLLLSLGRFSLFKALINTILFFYLSIFCLIFKDISLIYLELFWYMAGFMCIPMTVLNTHFCCIMVKLCKKVLCDVYLFKVSRKKR